MKKYYLIILVSIIVSILAIYIFTRPEFQEFPSLENSTRISRFVKPYNTNHYYQLNALIGLITKNKALDIKKLYFVATLQQKGSTDVIFKLHEKNSKTYIMRVSNLGVVSEVTDKNAYSHYQKLSIKYGEWWGSKNRREEDLPNQMKHDGDKSKDSDRSFPIIAALDVIGPNGKERYLVLDKGNTFPHNQRRLVIYAKTYELVTNLHPIIRRGTGKFEGKIVLLTRNKILVQRSIF